MIGAQNPEAAPITMLHVFPSFGYGGQQARFAVTAGGMGGAFSHHVTALDGDFTARSLVPYHAPVRYWKFPARKSAFISLANVIRYRKLLKDTKPDILCTYNWGSIEASIANRLGPRLPHLHFEDGFGPGESVREQKERRVIARRLLLRGAMVVVPSHELEAAAKDIWKLDASRVLRIENGVDYARFQTKSSRLGHRITIGAVGALRPEKNFTRLVNAFVKADQARKAALTIYGAGPERTHLRDSIESSGARDRISLPGPTRAPEEAYNEFDVFAISSDTEQAPLVLMEAMASGLPVVATNVGDIAKMVSEENRAFITPLGDEDAFVDALAHLMQDQDAREKIGAANSRKARDEFNAATMIERHRKLYLELARRHG